MRTLHQILGMTLATACLLTGGMQAATASEANTAGAVYAVVHVDIEPAKVNTALPLLQAFSEQARHDPAVRHIEVLQQTGAGNHFTIIEVLQSAQAYKDFVQTPYVISMRTQLQPMLGSPFDERLHALMPEGA
jgi:quinol monooxygenase YgiN